MLILFPIEQRRAGVVVFSMSEENVRLVMQRPWGDCQRRSSRVPATTNAPAQPLPPRSAASLSRKTISVEHAIRSCSGLPADILRLKDRGYLRAGYFADVVVFDPKTLRDKATYDEPHQYSTGVRYLFVNGKLAIDDGKIQPGMAGRVLRHPQK